MQRLILIRKHIAIGLLLLIVGLVTMFPVMAQDDAVEGDIYVAYGREDGRLVVFTLSGNTATIIDDVSAEARWQGWRLGEQAILLFGNNLGDDVPSSLAVVTADGLQFVEMDAETQALFNPAILVNYDAPYAVIVTNAQSDYSPALLIKVDTAEAEILTMDYPVVTPFRLSEDGSVLRYAEHGEEVTEQNIVERDLESGETTIVNVANANGRLMPDRLGQIWVEILPTPINPHVTLYGLDGESELVADGAQEAFYWVVGDYLVTNTDVCADGNCEYELHSLLDGTTTRVLAPEGIGFFGVQLLDDGKMIVPNTNDKAYWRVGEGLAPRPLGFSAGEVLGQGSMMRLSPDGNWFIGESVAAPGAPDLAVRIYNVDTTAIVGSIQGDGSVHGIWFGEERILIEMVTGATLFNTADHSFYRVPQLGRADFHAVLAGNLLLYSIDDESGDTRRGVYLFDIEANASTQLFEGLVILDLD